VVIGSGATAVTLAPEMARTAGHVTMLQRSPTYVVSRPAEDGLANWLRARLPAMTAYGITRWKNVLMQMLFFRIARKKPEKTKQQLLGLVREHLGPDYDIETHFTPRYNPWDQRLCLVPDADLFDSIKAGTSSVVTDQIETFTERRPEAEVGARPWTPTSSSPPRACACSCWARWRWWSTAGRSRRTRPPATRA
jgi:monooxygenase